MEMTIAIIIGYEHKIIKIWDIESSQFVKTLYGHTRPVNCCIFSNNGYYICSSSNDKTVKIWNGMNLIPMVKFAGKIS